MKTALAELDLTLESFTCWFIPGAKKVSLSKPATPARGYLVLDSESQAEVFCRRFQGHVFVDERGDSFRALVCRAPFSRSMEKTRRKKREGTIENCESGLIEPSAPGFIKFVEREKEPPVIPEQPPVPATKQSSLVTALLASSWKLPKLQETHGRRPKKKRVDNAPVTPASSPNPKNRPRRRRAKKAAEKKKPEAKPVRVLPREEASGW